MAFIKSGGTLLPICRIPSSNSPGNTNPSGNDPNRLNSGSENRLRSHQCIAPCIPRFPSFLLIVRAGFLGSNLTQLNPDPVMSCSDLSMRILSQYLKERYRRPAASSFARWSSGVATPSSESPQGIGSAKGPGCGSTGPQCGYKGGYTAVKEAVRAFRQKTQEVFIPLSHPRGWAQVDFGHAEITLAGERTDIAFFVMTLPFSDAFFICAFSRECTETFQEGHKRAFEFFEGVAVRISYDNSKIAVISIGKGSKRKLTDGFLRLQSHYSFSEHFCRVRRANEKGHVETLVGYCRRNFMVPVPTVETIEDLNHHLESCCRADLERTLRGKEKSK